VDKSIVFLSKIYWLDDFKGMNVVYKLSFTSSIKRCETILVYPEQKPPVKAKRLKGVDPRVISHIRRHRSYM
jgi:hypothetical protein